MQSLSQFPIAPTGRRSLPDELRQFLAVSEWGKRENRVWRDCSRHYAERRGYYLVNQQNWPIALQVNQKLMGGYISENITRTVAIAHARMCRERYIPEARSTNPMASQEDLFAENASNQFIRDHWERNRSQLRRDFIARNLLIDGDDFIGLAFDPDQIGTVRMTGDELSAYEKLTGRPPLQVAPIGENHKGQQVFRADVHTGGTTEYRVPASLVFVEDGPTEWDEVTRFVVLEYPSAYEAQMKWANAPGAQFIKPMTIQDLKGAGTGYYQAFRDFMRFDTQTDPVYASEVRGRTCIAEFWFKEGPYWHRNVRTGYNFPHEVHDQGGILVNPFVHYRYTRTGDFWSQGLVQGMLVPAYSLNVALTQLSSYISRSAKTTWMVPKGSKMTLMNNNYNTIVEYDGFGGHPPIMQVADQSILRIFQERIQLDMAFIDIGGQIGEAGMGDVPSRTSASVLQSTQEAVYGALGLAAAHMRDADKQLARKVLLINQELSDYPKMSRLFGGEGDVLIKAFKGSDIAGNTEITVTTSDTSPQARNERAKLFVDLAQFMMLPGFEERLEQFMDGTNLKALKPIDVRQSEIQANREYQLMMSGKVARLATTVLFKMDGRRIAEMGLQPTMLATWEEAIMAPVPLLQEKQDDAVHVARHMVQLGDPNTPYEVKQMLIYHIQFEHEHRMGIHRKLAEYEEGQRVALMSSKEATGQKEVVAIQGEIQKEIVDKDAEREAKEDASDGKNGKTPGGSAKEKAQGASAPATAASGGRRSGISRSVA